MMIGGKRGCGKTTELIKKAHEEHLYILCVDRRRVFFIADMAKEMGLQIPFPISIDEIPLRGYMNGILVDDVEDVLSALIRKPIIMASTNMELKAL